MTREDIIRMAREAGFVPHYTRPKDAIVRNGYAISGELKGYKAGMLDIERFAALVAAHEREACAKVCDGWLHANGDDCAAAIRARGEQEQPR